MTYNSSLIGCSGDIAALRINHEFPVQHLPCELSMNGVTYGQDVYFLGYPYDMKGNLLLHYGSDLPFVKKATISCLDKNIIYLDGHNNPGFSGGPVVFNPHNKPNEVKIAGVISGYRFNEEPIYINQEKTPHITYKYNTGIIIAYKIEQIVDVIKNTK
jgi:hypothetical protein